MSSWFSHVEEAPKDPILGVTEKFLADKSPQKINLGVGAYRDDAGKPVVLDVVRQAEKLIIDRNLNNEYLPIGGHRDFCIESIKLAYGETATPILENRVAVVQALSGTGACRLMAEFQHRWFPKGSKMYFPNPTWSNHLNIWHDAGVEIDQYPYYDAATKGLAFEKMCDALNKAPAGSAVLLHACAHNPTGVDPTAAQWAELSKLFKEKNLFPLFDSAYQGYATGDVEKDASAVRTFMNDGHTLALAQSFAKNFGLYGQRVGALSVVCENDTEAAAVESQLKLIARPIYSNPPLHGAQVVHTILSDPKLKAKWYTEVAGMAHRIIDMRTKLRDALEKLGSKHSWKHVTDQIGMFAYLGLTPEQVDRMTGEYSIYLTRNGRISMAGVNSKNVERVAEAVHEVTK
jgi:aspartate aminotransferase